MRLDSLPPAIEVWGKVMFLHLCVILFTGLPSMHHRSHDQGSASGEGLHPGGGVCIKGAGSASGGWAESPQYYRIRSIRGWYASY